MARETVVTTRFGKLEGAREGGILSFKAIPYAAPPLGPRRFRAPAPPEKWDGVRDATRFGPVCPQLNMMIEGPLAALGIEEPQDEDCLFLNVWTPALDDARRPVMVWIHGGAFTSGSGSTPMYDGTRFAESGVVLVTVNYRLHALGFLHLSELFDGFEGSGNCGILDQIAALEWVRDNVASFGGDPANVTIFGESAGGMSVGTLLGTPSARGLYSRAIPQSGAGHHNLSAETATRVARLFLENAGVKPGDAEALERIPVDLVVGASVTVGQQPPEAMADLLGDDALKKMAWQPVVDGVVRDRLPLDAVAKGQASGVDLLVGNCAEEWRLFTYGMPESMRDILPRPDVARYFAKSGRSPDEVLKAYGVRFPTLAERDLLDAIETDLFFGIPASRLADAQRRHHESVWAYRVSWRSPVSDLGACHAIDIPFVFANLDLPAFLGDAPPAQLADVMHRSWVAFAASGDPNIDGLPTWPAYDPGSRPVMDFDSTCRVVEAPDAATRPLWDGVI